MKIYTPHQMNMYQFCGIYRQLMNEGWIEKYIGPKMISRLIGSAVAEGIHLFWAGLSDSDIIQSAYQEYEKGLKELQESGCIFSETGEQADVTAHERIYKFLMLAIKQNPFPSDKYQILSVETPLSNNARPDLVISFEGSIEIVDYKTSSSLLPKQWDKFFREQFHGNQAHIYKYVYEQDHSVHINSFGVVLLSLNPYQLVYRSQVFDEERHALWLDSARTTWKRMKLEDDFIAIAEENPDHASKYGACEFQLACLTMNRHADLMRQHYIEIEGKDSENDYEDEP